MDPKAAEILVKSDDETNPDYGCVPEKRPLGEYIKKGFVNIDKNAGPTSHQISAWVKNILQLSKAGHSGTLDPNVTGVLPIALEDSVRIVNALLLSGKEYVGVMVLHEDASNEKLEKLFKEFTGEIYQRPPVKSAVKRSLRTRKIYQLELMEKEGRETLFRVNCEAGTYIRKLCHDIGLVSGAGAHMQELRRTRVGPFNEENAVSLTDLKDAYVFYQQDGKEETLRKHIKPMEYAVQDLKSMWVKDTAVDALCHGAPLTAPGVSKLESEIKEGEQIALFTLKGELIALAEATKNADEIMASEKGIAAKLKRVAMPEKTYPRSWKQH